MDFDFDSLHKKDLRIRRTHKLLTDALFSLLETTHYDNITVVTICEKAMVHRATFYKHFKDKDEFVEYITRVKLHELYIASMKNADHSDMKSLYKAVIDTTLTFVEENKAMLRFAATNSNTSLLVQIHKIIQSAMIRFIDLSKHYGETYFAPADVVSSFLTGGFITLVFWWIASENSYTKKDIQLHLERLLLITDMPDDEKLQQ